MCSRLPQRQQRQTAWSRAGSWLRDALCCSCTCCGKINEDLELPTVNQATVTVERVSRQHRPHAPGSRKSTPEMLTAVRCALSQLQGEPAPPITQAIACDSPTAQEVDEQVCKTNKGKAERVNYFTVN